MQKEGADDSALAVEQEPDTVVCHVCDNCCDHNAKTLEIPIDPTLPAKKGKKLMAYMVCQSDYWKDLCDPVSGFEGSSWKDFHEALPEEHAAELAVLDLHVDFQTKRGGKASVTSKKKKSVIRAVWRLRPVQDRLVTDPQRRAFEWLMCHNNTYKIWVENHHRELAARATDRDPMWRHFRTAELLLQFKGVEIAARPILYPLVPFADTDISLRLQLLERLTSTQKPSFKASWMRKILSRCADYASDYILQNFLYDTAMARTISAVVAIAADKKMASEEIAPDMPSFEVYWNRETQKLEDLCRQKGCPPNVFITLAPAE